MSAQAPGPTEPGPVTTDAGPPAVVVRGHATPEEVAALVAVLSAVSGGDDDAASDGTASTWAAHSAAMRRPVGHGPGAWRTSLRP